jgi:hypothetical protein
MEQETIEYLDTVACIARSNMLWHQRKSPRARSLDEAGAALLMGCYLELYDIWQSEIAGQAPPPRIHLAAASCVEMRRQLEQRPRTSWSDEEEGLFRLMTAFMFLFKHLYVARH